MVVRLAKKAEDKELSELWLRSTLTSHDFIPKAFWEKRVHVIELAYIGKSITFVCEEGFRGSGIQE